MSKVDAMRALREARRAAGPQPTASRPSPVTPAVAASRQAKPRPAAPDAAATPPSSESCGHRSMNGKSCTRDAGHAEKNHRYG